uniref:Uncharacterized protein n=1 Tax=Anguilla anguilla TaxID=7936 RepID=A0A0E9TZ07_ANGAN
MDSGLPLVSQRGVQILSEGEESAWVLLLPSE